MSHGWALTLDTTSISLDLTLCDSPEECTEEAINAFFDSIDGVVVVFAAVELGLRRWLFPERERHPPRAVLARIRELGPQFWGALLR